MIAPTHTIELITHKHKSWCAAIAHFYSPHKCSTDSFASEQETTTPNLPSETGHSPKELVGGVDVFQAFRGGAKQKPQWSDSPAAQTAIQALSALSDSQSASDHMGGHDDENYADENYAEETALHKAAVNETVVDETALDETAPLHDIEDAAPYTPDVDVARDSRTAYEDHTPMSARMPTRRSDGV